MLNRPWYPSILAGFLAVASVGCATKGYVRDTVSPVTTRVGEVETKTADNTTKIETLEGRVETDVSRLDERTQSNEQRAREAAEAAQSADQKAVAAQSSADKGLSMVGSLEQSVNRKFEGLDNYQLASDETILFKLNSAELSDEAMAQLDAAAGKIGSMKYYVVEVRGYTDTSGSATTNLALSRGRADAVVRYLTVVKEIPLHRIHVIGAGSENPAADNSNREGREQNRRVEVKLFVANVDGASMTSSDRAVTAQTR